MPSKIPVQCQDLRCRRYPLTIREFERLGGQQWSHGFRIQMGLLASKLYVELYKKQPGKKRTHIAWRNAVNRYPCGILEQAYRQLKGQAEAREHTGITA
jgi:hypothetical protein